jgi:hypothetical protein
VDADDPTVEETKSRQAQSANREAPAALKLATVKQYRLPTTKPVASHVVAPAGDRYGHAAVVVPDATGRSSRWIRKPSSLEELSSHVTRNEESDNRDTDSEDGPFGIWSGATVVVVEVVVVEVVVVEVVVVVVAAEFWGGAMKTAELGAQS